MKKLKKNKIKKIKESKLKNEEKYHKLLL